MKTLPIKLAEFNLVVVKTTNDCDPSPHCVKHGAMNRITADGFWRCIAVSGYTPTKDGNGKKHKETICRAGCLDVDAWVDFVSDKTNRSVNQTNFLLNLLRGNMEKLLLLEEKIKEHRIRYCPGDLQEVERILMMN